MAGTPVRGDYAQAEAIALFLAHADGSARAGNDGNLPDQFRLLVGPLHQLCRFLPAPARDIHAVRLPGALLRHRHQSAHARATGATGDRAHSQQFADFALWHHPTQRPGSAALGWGRHLTRGLKHGQRDFRGGLSHTDRSTDSSTHHPKFQRYPEPGRSTAERHPARCGLHLHHRRTTAHDMVFTEPRPLAWSGSGGGPLPLSSADHAATPRVDRKRGAIPGMDGHTKRRRFWPGGARHQRRTGGAGGVGAQRQNRDLRRRRIGCAGLRWDVALLHRRTQRLAVAVDRMGYGGAGGSDGPAVDQHPWSTTNPGAQGRTTAPFDDNHRTAKRYGKSAWSDLARRGGIDQTTRADKVPGWQGRCPQRYPPAHWLRPGIDVRGLQLLLSG